MKVNDVVQFTESHKWVGCLGIITEVKPSRYMVAVPIPQKGTAYIFDDGSGIECVGEAVLIPGGGDDEQ